MTLFGITHNFLYIMMDGNGSKHHQNKPLNRLKQTFIKQVFIIIQYNHTQLYSLMPSRRFTSLEVCKKKDLTKKNIPMRGVVKSSTMGFNIQMKIITPSTIREIWKL